MSNTPKKILFVTRPLQKPWDEGSKNFAHDLARHITEHEVTILTNGTVDDVPDTVRQQSIYTQNEFNLIQKIKLVFWLYFNAKNYDVIHLLFTPSTLNASILKRLIPLQSHVIQTIATIRDDLYPPKRYRDIFFGDTLVTYSQYAKDKLTREGFDNVIQIYPGVDLEKYHPEGKNAELVEKWNIKLNEFVVAYPGEFARLGATDVIIDAFLEIWSDPANAHIKYLCACRVKNTADEVKKSEVRERVRIAGHLDKVIFVDTFSGNMNDIYNLADLIIFPVVNMYGKFDVPLAMIEPYACKKIVVASDLPVFAEFSKDDINVIIPRNSSSDITNAILSIVRNSSKHVRRGEEAYNFAHHNFDITQNAQHYKNLYDTI